MLIDDFFVSKSNDIEAEKRNRIRVSLAAYAYEILNQPIMSDAEFDELALRVDPDLQTDNKELDNFFKTEYNPYTGQWIHKHPGKDGLIRILKKVYGI